MLFIMKSNLFEMNNKSRSIVKEWIRPNQLKKRTTTFRELENMVYKVTSIEHFNQIIMKFIFFSCYELDSIKIKNNDNVYCFVKKQ